MFRQKFVFALVSLALLVLTNNVGAQDENTNEENEVESAVISNNNNENSDFENAAGQTTNVDQEEVNQEENESNEQVSRQIRAVRNKCRSDRECSRGFVCTYVGRSLIRKCQPYKRRF